MLGSVQDPSAFAHPRMTKIEFLLSDGSSESEVGYLKTF